MIIRVKKTLPDCKIAVLGGGPVGMLAALELSILYPRIVLIGSQSCYSHDERTTALMIPAIRILKKHGIWIHLKKYAAPLAVIQILDGTGRLIRSPCVNFFAKEMGISAFGYNIPNIILNNALSFAIEKCSHIYRIHANAIHFDHTFSHVIVMLSNGDMLETSLLVAADGKDSLARKAAQISVYQWNYPQSAIVLNFSHQLPHNNTSTEFHTVDGPLTQVPLLGKRSSLVWVVNQKRAQNILGLGIKALESELEISMYSILGKVIVESFPQIWPLSGTLPKSFAKRRILLTGEAAHVFPPIGAQGLNLGIRDVLDLTKIITNNISDPGTEKVLYLYNKSRRFDIWIRTAFIHLLNQTLLSDFLPAQFVRSIGLEILRVSPFFRKFFVKEGLHPGSSSIKNLFLQKKDNFQE